ncbi:MAG: CDP-diacylglycerol--glycerol-3-phosphate 3-phosphatidyltransferase [Desulfobacca sp.]|uniref:CDP-diacylglycerol--glycerol-3-phosphate 3-phosphatidyltransferase n=1 Tax=Desulfobacca sp. TaxID=2067990 RepID=UPI00404A4809
MAANAPVVNSPLTIPNLITMVRILATPLLVIFLLQNSYEKALLVFLVAGLSDLADGYIARNFQQKSPLGAVLDPLADKLLMTASYLTLGYFGKIPAWLTVVVISRDVVIVGGIIILKLFAVNFRIDPAQVSKWATAAQIITVFLAIWRQLATVPLWFFLLSCWLTAILTVASGLVYLLRGLQLLNHADD